MRPIAFSLILYLASAGGGSAQQAAKKITPAAKPVQKNQAPQTAKKSTPQPQAAKKSAPTAKKSTSTAKKSSPSKKKGGSRYATRRPQRQMQPTQQRFREIQQALQQRGYLQVEPTGVWGPDWADALKKFQQDQNLNPTGKLDSLSLIALGLGPKRENGLQTRTEPR